MARWLVARFPGGEMTGYHPCYFSRKVLYEPRNEGQIEHKYCSSLWQQDNKKLLECAFSGKSMLLVLPRRLKTRK